MKRVWRDVRACVRAKVADRSGLVRLITNTAWLFSDQLLSIGLGLGIGVWVARYLGKEQLGILSYATAFVGMFMPLAQLGFGHIVARDVVRHPEAKGEILGTAFLLLCGGAVVVVGLVGGIVWVLRPEDALARRAVGIASVTVLFHALDVISFWFVSQTQAKYVVWSKQAALVLAALAKVGLILSGASVLAFAWVSSAQAAASSVGLLVAYCYSGQSPRGWTWKATQAQKLLSDSWPLILTSSAETIYARLDNVMLGQMLGDAEVGVYGVAARIAQLLCLVPAAISSSVFPAIVRSREHQSAKVFEGRMQAFYDVMAAISLSVALPLALLAKPIVLGLYGAEYADAGPILTAYAFSLPFTFLGLARARWLVTENRNQFYLLSIGLGAVTNVGLNLWLVPRYGSLGAAWSTVASSVVASYLSLLLWRPFWPAFRQLSLALLIPFRLRALGRSLDGIR